MSARPSWGELKISILREVNVLEKSINQVFDTPFFGSTRRFPFPRGGEASLGLIAAIGQISTRIDKAEAVIKELTRATNVQCSGKGGLVADSCSLSASPVEFPEDLRTIFMEIDNQNNLLKAKRQEPTSKNLTHSH